MSEGPVLHGNSLEADAEQGKLDLFHPTQDSQSCGEAGDIHEQNPANTPAGYCPHLPPVPNCLW